MFNLPKPDVSDSMLKVTLTKFRCLSFYFTGILFSYDRLNLQHFLHQVFLSAFCSLLFPYSISYNAIPQENLFLLSLLTVTCKYVFSKQPHSAGSQSCFPQEKKKATSWLCFLLFHLLCSHGCSRQISLLLSHSNAEFWKTTSILPHCLYQKDFINLLLEMLLADDTSNFGCFGVVSNLDKCQSKKKTKQTLTQVWHHLFYNLQCKPVFPLSGSRTEQSQQ